MRARRWTAVAVASLLALDAASATTWRVANNGQDNAACACVCGPAATPCRSLRQAITNANAGDTVLVGPGVYGDLNGDGLLGNSPGEEIPTGGAMIAVSKPLTIRSRDGAGATVLDASGLSLGAVVITGAAGVNFGTPNHGFTVRGGLNGIHVFVGPARVRGNRTLHNDVGIVVQSGTGSLVDRNVGNDNTTSAISDGGVTTVVSRNLAVGSSLGFYLAGTDALARRNVAVANDIGVDVVSPPPGPTPAVQALSRTTIVGNRGRGLLLLMTGLYTNDVSLGLFGNNYFGNGDLATNPVPNCGVRLAIIDTASTPHTLYATTSGDFWGGPGGPGPNPRDLALGPCDVPISGNTALSILSPAATEFVGPPPIVR
jgi:hypothetical protein